ncbi:MAG: TPM domain-containing protein [Hydrogenibacillus sp.]|nr:TPM domain-containing protein [Hydrogenibacillus sp.]
MTRVARALDRAAGAQLVVVTVDRLGGVPIEEYALKLFRAWGIGRRDRNNGVLLLVNKENMLADRPGRRGWIDDDSDDPPFWGGFGGGSSGGGGATR